MPPAISLDIVLRIWERLLSHASRINELGLLPGCIIAPAVCCSPFFALPLTVVSNLSPLASECGRVPNSTRCAMLAGSSKIGLPALGPLRMTPICVLNPRRGPMIPTTAFGYVAILMPSDFLSNPRDLFSLRYPLASIRCGHLTFAALRTMLELFRTARRSTLFFAPFLTRSSVTKSGFRPSTLADTEKLTASPHTTSVASSTQSLSWRSRYGTSPCRKIDRPPGKSRRHWLTGNSPAPPSSWRQA